MLRKNVNTPYRNQGAALLLFVLVTMVIGSAILLKALNIKTTSSTATKDRQVLMQAKEALIGYALRSASRNPNSLPGSLPCPDIDGDGIANAPCGISNQSAMGRLPWKTLGLPALRDSSENCLWYAVSGRYKETPPGSLSTDANGQFLLFDSALRSLNGANFSNTAIAVVFAPGQPINGQNRSLSANQATECGSKIPGDGVNNSSNYLDRFNGFNNADGRYQQARIANIPVTAIPATGFSVFLQSGHQKKQSLEIFNDALIALTPLDYQPVYAVMQRWLGTKVQTCFNAYAAKNDGKLPQPVTGKSNHESEHNKSLNHIQFGRIPVSENSWPKDPLNHNIDCFKWNWWASVRNTVFYSLQHNASGNEDGNSPSTENAKTTTASIKIIGRKTSHQGFSKETDQYSKNKSPKDYLCTLGSC